MVQNQGVTGRRGPLRAARRRTYFSRLLERVAYVDHCSRSAHGSWSKRGKCSSAFVSGTQIRPGLSPSLVSARSRVRTSPRRPPASFGMPAYPAWNRSSSLTSRPISFSSDDEIEQICRYPRPRTGSSIPASEKISCMSRASVMGPVVRHDCRPLGLEADPRDDSLIVCDAYRGLLRVDETGHVRVLADTHGGRRLKFTNNAAVAADGSVYFSDSSTQYRIEHYKHDLLEHRPNGRVFRYRPPVRASTSSPTACTFRTEWHSPATSRSCWSPRPGDMTYSASPSPGPGPATPSRSRPTSPAFPTTCPQPGTAPTGSPFPRHGLRSSTG